MTNGFLRDAPELKGKRVTVMGLGLFGGGVGVSRFLARRGASVTVTDLRSEKELRESVDELRKFPIRFVLGRHDEADFRNADIVLVNPGVPPESPYLAVARKAGAALESEMNLFFKLCPARIVGVTGSNGKTTSAALIYHMLKADDRRAWLGGNIGKPLLEDVAKIRRDDIVVLEISSFQLEHLGAIGVSPHVAVVTNITPNHLDRHKTMRNYIAAKANLVKFQKPGDIAVLNRRDRVVSGWADRCKGRALFFALDEAVPRGACVIGSDLIFKPAKNRKAVRVCGTSGTKLIGRFNLDNVAAAACAALALGVSHRAVEKTVNTFRGVEHRLEFVTKVRGVSYYNDSIATNPDSVVAALNAFNSPVVLIAGGRDKNLPMDGMARLISGKAHTVVLVGEAADKIQAVVEAQPRIPKVVRCKTLEEAVVRAAKCARSGDVVLFSPACASFDMFRNFRERGEVFKKAVAGLR